MGSVLLGQNVNILGHAFMYYSASCIWTISLPSYGQQQWCEMFPLDLPKDLIFLTLPTPDCFVFVLWGGGKYVNIVGKIISAEKTCHCPGRSRVTRLVGHN